MTSDGDSADRPKGSIFDLFSNKSYKKHARALAKKKTTWPATEDLLAAIIANSKEPIPPVVLDHLRRRLDGTAKKPRGRKPPDSLALIRRSMIPITYEKFLRWLQRRETTQGLTGWECIHKAPWWVGSPHERAARMTQAIWARHADWRHVLNNAKKGS